jgi:hypothetical protein
VLVKKAVADCCYVWGGWGDGEVGASSCLLSMLFSLSTFGRNMPVKRAVGDCYVCGKHCLNTVLRHL